VTLALENADVLRAIGSQLEAGERAKFIEFPSAVYSMHPFDRVVARLTALQQEAPACGGLLSAVISPLRAA
jgi:hypothetical protein